jgi:hypothetical protein
MKNLKLINAIVLCIITFNNYAQPTDNLVANWPFNGNANDESGNGNNGIVYGATLVNGIYNKEYKAYKFDGVNDYISIENGNLFYNSEGKASLSFWLNTSSSKDEVIFMNKPTYSSANGIEIWHDNTDICIRGGGTKIVRFSSVFQLNTWVHLVVEFDGKNISLYVNGVFKGSGVGEQFGISTSNLEIGRYYGTNQFFLTGKIDNIWVYNRVLTLSEIQTLYDEEVNALSNGWQINEKMVYINDANVSIGTNIIPEGFNFAVNGKIVAKEVKVTLDEWPDFVFKPNYDLMPINEIENFIINNNHLPSIPTEDEVKEKGVYLGELNAKLLQKVEELTLYIIEQNKKIENLQNQINELKE